MNTLLLALLASLASPTTSVQEAFQMTEFRPRLRVESLPSRLKSALAEVTHGERIANPNERWEATDNLIDPSLPRRRLILGGVSKNMSFVYYEHGGRGKHEHLLILTGNQKSGFRPVRNLSMTHGPVGMKELTAFVASGKASPASDA